MSTLLYSALTTRRIAAEAGTSSTSGQPGIKTYADAMAALVPAEVLAAQAVIVSYATAVTKNANGQQVTMITDPGWLKVAFYGLIVISIGLYLGGRFSSTQGLQRLDFARMLIPPAAFVLWTMLQKTTTFDAVAPSFSAAGRSILAILLAIVVGALASLLGYKADQNSA
jgi:hypothetical protein